MSNQLNIPVPACLPVDASTIASKLNDKLQRQIGHNVTRLTGKEAVLERGGSDHLQPYRGWRTETLSIPVKHFTADPKPCTVAGIDSSCIPVGHTAEGTIYAVKAVVVFSTRGGLLSYLKVGPILTYIDEDAASSLLQRAQGGRLSHILLLDRAIAQKILRGLLERLVAFEVAGALTNSVILLDGSLRRSRLEGFGVSLTHVLEVATEAGNGVIGLSKATRIGLLNRLSHVLYNSRRLPAYADVDRLVAPLLSGVEGRILLVRFTEDGHPFRADVYPEGEAERLLSLAYSNDIFYHGYPETLRLAHHLTIFTRGQLDCLKSYLVKNVGVIDLPSEDLRYTALGRLGFKGRV